MTTDADLIHAAFARWNAGDLDGYLTLYADTIQLHGYTPAPMDKAAVTGFYQMVMGTMTAPGAASPPIEFKDIVSEGDRVCCRFVMSGVHTGPFMGIPATGRPFSVEGITILRFAGGRVVERWSQVDMLGLMVQIGAVTLPA